MAANAEIEAVAKARRRRSVVETPPARAAGELAARSPAALRQSLPAGRDGAALARRGGRAVERGGASAFPPHKHAQDYARARG